MFSLLSDIQLVTEFMEGGTLSEAVRGFDFKPEQIAYIAQEVNTAPNPLGFEGAQLFARKAARTP